MAIDGQQLLLITITCNSLHFSILIVIQCPVMAINQIPIQLQLVAITCIVTHLAADARTSQTDFPGALPTA